MKSAISTYLDFSLNAGTFHATGQVDGVPPDVIMWLSSSYDTCNHWPLVDTYSQLEIVVECVSIYLRQCFLHFKREIDAGLQVLPDVVLRLKAHQQHVTIREHRYGSDNQPLRFTFCSGDKPTQVM